MSFTFNIPAIVSHHGQMRGDHIALIDDSREISFGELERRVSQWSNQYYSLGLRPGDHIGLCLNDHADHVIAILAAMRTQNPVLCMDWKSSLEEVEDRVARFDLKLVLCDRQINLPTDVGVFRDDSWREAIARTSEDFPLPPLAEETTALLAASSGSTGKPGVVRVTHRALFARAIGDNWLAMSPGVEDRFLQALPIAFSTGRGFTLAYLFGGCTMAMMPSPYTPADFVDAIERHGITHTITNPTVLRWVVDRAPENGHLLAGLKVLICTGGTLKADLRRDIVARLSPNLFEQYGAVATGVMTGARPEDMQARPDSVGRPAFGVDLKVVDEDDNVVPPGTVGAVRCRSPQAAIPYEDENGGSGRGDQWGGFLPTDDHGRFDEDGFLYIVGRSASLIIRAGLNIYAEELEEVLRDHPRIRDVAVLGRPSATLGEEPVALIVPQENIDLDNRDLIAYCRARIAPNKVPMDFFYVDELPRALAGKLNRAALPALLRALTEEREAAAG